MLWRSNGENLVSELVGGGRGGGSDRWGRPELKDRPGFPRVRRGYGPGELPGHVEARHRLDIGRCEGRGRSLFRRLARSAGRRSSLLRARMKKKNQLEHAHRETNGETCRAGRFELSLVG